VSKSNIVELNIIHDHIAFITLNRPDAAHSLSYALLKELNQKIKTINHDPNIYCTIFTGAGEKVFCAGADLKERKNMSGDQVTKMVKYIDETMINIEEMSMPTIAAINGVAYGGGLELALACDLRIAANHALMALTETSLGIIPGAGGTQRLMRLVGIGQAKKIIFTAQPIHAEEALHIHLIEKAVHAKDLRNEVIHLAKMITKNGPIALKQAKIAMNQGSDIDLKTGLMIEHHCYQQTIHTEDRVEGLQAFKEKRIPIFKGK